MRLCRIENKEDDIDVPTPTPITRRLFEQRRACQTAGCWSLCQLQRQAATHALALSALLGR